MSDIDPAAVSLCPACTEVLRQADPSLSVDDLTKYLCRACKRRTKHAISAARKDPDEDGFKPLK